MPERHAKTVACRQEVMFHDYAALSAEGGHSKEERRRRHDETRGRPLAEIWRELGRT